MKRQMKEKKLRLNKVTITALNPVEMDEVKGGSFCPPPSWIDRCDDETRGVSTSCGY